MYIKPKNKTWCTIVSNLDVSPVDKGNHDDFFVGCLKLKKVAQDAKLNKWVYL